MWRFLHVLAIGARDRLGGLCLRRQISDDLRRRADREDAPSDRQGARRDQRAARRIRASRAARPHRRRSPTRSSACSRWRSTRSSRPTTCPSRAARSIPSAASSSRSDCGRQRDAERRRRRRHAFAEVSHDRARRAEPRAARQDVAVCRDALAAKAARECQREAALSGAVRRAASAWLARLVATRIDLSGARIAQLALILGLAYVGIGGKLVMLGLSHDPPQTLKAAADQAASGARPDLLDRNGEILATDVKTMSVFAEPRRIIDKDEAVELITAVLPDVDAQGTARAAELEEGLRLDQAPGHAEGAAGDLSSRPARRRLLCPRTSASIPTARSARMCSAMSTRTISASPAWRNISTSRA